MFISSLCFPEINDWSFLSVQVPRILHLWKFLNSPRLPVFLAERSDQRLHCLPFRLHLLDPLLCSKTIPFQFQDNYSSFSGVGMSRIFMVFINFPLNKTGITF